MKSIKALIFQALNPCVLEYKRKVLGEGQEALLTFICPLCLDTHILSIPITKVESGASLRYKPGHKNCQCIVCQDIRRILSFSDKIPPSYQEGLHEGTPFTLVLDCFCIGGNNGQTERILKKIDDSY